jgi:peptide deformylase
MSVRAILSYPDKRLREPTQQVTQFDAELARLLNDMAETMYAAPGIGLAAPQIGVALRVFVIDVVTEDGAAHDLRVFVNPQILERSGQVASAEGCLSLPGLREELTRYERVRIRAQDARGESFELATDGLLAIAIQHEDDHIEGRMIVDHLSGLRRRVAQRALMKRTDR